MNKPHKGKKRKRIILVGLNKKYFKGDLQNILKESGTMRQISQNGLSFPLQDRLRAKEKISINKYEKATIRKQIS